MTPFSLLSSSDSTVLKVIEALKEKRTFDPIFYPVPSAHSSSNAI